MAGKKVVFLPGLAGERALVAGLVAGDEAAFRECYEQHAPRVLRILTRLLRSQAWAEEVLQDSFIAAFRAIGEFRGEARLGSWLVGIAMRRGFNAIRGEDRRERNKPEAAEHHDAEPRLLERETSRRILKLLDEMDPEKKATLLLFGEGHTAAEIAEILEQPRGTILSRLSRARAELAERAAAAGLMEPAMLAEEGS
jgi:RNA polymerase sigma-70 factor (ECF subfamily)